LAQQEEEREREREQERQRRSNLETRLERTVAFSVGFCQNVCQVVPLLFPVVTACKELLNYREPSLNGQPSQCQLEQLEHVPAVSTRGGGVGDAERSGDREGAGGTEGGGGSESSSSRHSRDASLGVDLHPARKWEGWGGGEGGVLGISRGILRKIWERRSVGWCVVCGGLG
jgi:hypothetical protein